MSSKEQLITATQQLLWEKGYDATSPRDILTRSGVGQGALYHHFRGKLDLAIAAMEATVDTMIAEIDTLFAPDKPPMGRVWDYLTHPRPALQGCRAGRMVAEGSVAGSPLHPPLKRYFETVRSRVADALTEAGDQGSIDLPAPPEDVAALLVATVQGGYLLARASGDEEGMDAPVRGALSLLELLVKR